MKYLSHVTEGQSSASPFAPLRDTVTLLIHGLAETPMIMAPAEVGIRALGGDVVNLGYPSTLEAPQALAEQFILPVLKAHEDAAKLNIVTHSLGGVLAHYCLQTWRPKSLGRVVMTAPGLHGSEALEVYRHNFLFRMLFGPSAYRSGTGDDGFARFLPKDANYELGVIAGCVSSDPIANTFIPWPHDGKISVPRTKLSGMADHIVLPLAHDYLSSAPLAVYQIEQFLIHGRFSRQMFDMIRAA